ncbi:hypothetical protein [Mycolicibacterium houstonense]|uniref:hypothetical protein n=1 Tax=Mycolicibacterium houstonense TaxID=146021 RepID=UPI00082A3807|nr:hypothetical protein [Mycolicibacterium houstonense]
MPQIATIHLTEHHQTLMFVDAEVFLDGRDNTLIVLTETGGKTVFPWTNVSFWSQSEITDEELAAYRALRGEESAEDKLRKELGFE